MCAEPVGAGRSLRKLLAVLLGGHTHGTLLGRRLLVCRRTSLTVHGLVPLWAGFVVYCERFVTSAARTYGQHPPYIPDGFGDVCTEELSTDGCERFDFDFENSDGIAVDFAVWSFSGDAADGEAGRIHEGPS